MKKRFPAFFLALALCLGLAVPAFAAETGTSAKVYTYISDDFPYVNQNFEYKWRTLDGNYTYGEAEDDKDNIMVVPTHESFYVGVYDLAKDEQNEILMMAFTDHDGDGVYDQRLFQAQLELDTNTVTDITVLPIPESGTYKPTGAVSSAPQIALIPGFGKVEDGNYAFSAARLHEFFGNNTLVFFYLDNALLGGVLLSAGAFDDVPGVGWYSDPVAWAAEKGITTGTGDGEFTPGDDCTHIQILTFLSRAAGNTKAADIPWAIEQALVIQWAKEKGMIDDSFDAQKPCTRAEAVNYIWQAKDKPSAQPSSFTDMEGYEDYAKAVDWANEKKVTTGVGGGKFDPGSVCNRAYIVTFLYRAYN